MLPQKSQSEKFVDNIYAFSILILLVMAIAALYITDLTIPMVLSSTALFIFMLHKSSFLAIFLSVLIIGYAQAKEPQSPRRRRALVRILRLIMLVFLILAVLTYNIAGLWNSYYSQPIQVAFFTFFSLIEIFVLEIHTMAFSLPSRDSSGQMY